MANQKAMERFRKLLEAKRVPMYHSIFSAAKTGQHAGQWGHVFDADDKEDARYEADSERRQGQHAKVFTVPKDSAHWHERDVHHYVTQRIAGKKHSEIEKKPKTTNEAKETHDDTTKLIKKTKDWYDVMVRKHGWEPKKAWKTAYSGHRENRSRGPDKIGEATDPNLTWSPFNNYSAWERNAKHRGLVVHKHTNPSGKMTPYFSAKDKEGNHRGHFDGHTKKGELAEQTLSELSKTTLGSYAYKATHNYGLNLVRATEPGRSKEREDKAWSKTGKRDRGIRRALSRLTKA